MIESKMIDLKWSKVKWLTQNDRLVSWETFLVKWSTKWLAPKWSTEGWKNCPPKWSTKWSTTKWSMLDVTGKKHIIHVQHILRGLGGRKQATCNRYQLSVFYGCTNLYRCNACLYTGDLYEHLKTLPIVCFSNSYSAAFEPTGARHCTQAYQWNGFTGYSHT